MSPFRIAASVALAGVSSLFAQGISIALTEPILNLSNPADANGYGSVSYSYRIGMTEVTNAQYVTFLNATAANDPHGLYNTAMGTSVLGGIAQSGSPGSFSYSLKSTEWGALPVNFVSYWDASRFVNWLENGQGSGSTETGVYALNGVSNPTFGSISRSATANWVLPTENEWYKAAYYDPTKDGSGGYWLHAPRSATLGNNTNFGATNGANYNDGDYVNNDNPSIAGRGAIPVGSYPSASSTYGTFDQAGNLWEWTGNGSAPWIRGGSFQDQEALQRSSYREAFGPNAEDHTVGFRVASLVAIPEPGVYGLLMGGFSFAWMMQRRRNGVRFEAKPGA